jgi:steroid delta-isomerase-like uncharacterized protein
MPETSEVPKKPAKPRRSAKSREVEEVARSYFSAVSARDPEKMAEHWHVEGVDDIVPVAVLRGPVEVEGYFRELFRAMPDFDFRVQNVVADERRAAVEWRATGTFTGGPLMGLEPNGRRIELRGVDLAEVEDKKLVRNTAYYDGAAMARQLGMLPEQDSGAEKAMKGAFNAVTKVRKAIDERTG